MTDPNTAMQPYALSPAKGGPTVSASISPSNPKKRTLAAAPRFSNTPPKKGEEPPGHTHPSENEMFYILEGALNFRCGPKTFDLEKGGFIFLARGIQHGYTIRSDGVVRLLVVTSRAGPAPTKG